MAPDVPIVAPATPVPPAAETNDGTQLLGPEGEPIDQETRAEGGNGNSAPSTETGHARPADQATTQASRRPGGLYPLPVWPD